MYVLFDSDQVLHGRRIFQVFNGPVFFKVVDQPSDVGVTSHLVDVLESGHFLSERTILGDALVNHLHRHTLTWKGGIGG